MGVISGQFVGETLLLHTNLGHFSNEEKCRGNIIGDDIGSNFANKHNCSNNY